MPVELKGGCRAFELREGEPLATGRARVWRHVGRERGADAISLSILEIAPRSSTAWRNGGSDEILFFVSGGGIAVFSGERWDLRPDAGVYVRPGVRVALENPGPASLLLASSRCPDPGPEIHFESESPGEPAGDSGLGSPVVYFEDQPTERAGDGRWFRVLVDAKAGCDPVTQFVGFIPPGRAPEHFHEYEEVICILEGEGRFWSGAASTPIAAGSGIYLPRRQPHCVENTGSAPLKLCGLFYPAGSPAVRYHPGGEAR